MVFIRRRGGLGLQKHSQVLKNSQPRVGEGSGEVGMVPQVLPGFEFGILPLHIPSSWVKVCP